MKTITTVEPQRHNRRRANVYVDGRFAASLSLELVAAAGLRAGASIADDELSRLLAADDDYRALDNAYTYLSYRPRSEREIRQRLRQKRYDATQIDRVLDQLRAQGLVDDTAFSQYWRQNRDSFSPRGACLLRLELRKKGVDADTAAEVTADLDDEQAAYRAGEKQARRLAKLPYPDFRRKLGSILARRGFDYEVIGATVLRLWQEVGLPSADDPQADAPE